MKLNHSPKKKKEILKKFNVWGNVTCFAQACQKLKRIKTKNKKQKQNKTKKNKKFSFL